MATGDKIFTIGAIARPVNSDILKELRKDKKLTQDDIGERLGMAGSTYASYETGRRRMRIELLENIADELGTSTDYILGRTAIQKPYPKR